MSGLNQLDLGMFDTPAPKRPEPSPAPAEPRFLVRFRKTRAGHAILLCSVTPFPVEVLELAEKEKLPVFSFRDIEIMRDCDPQMVDHVVAVKREFPGSQVEAIITEGRA